MATEDEMEETKIFGGFTRDLWNVFKKYDDNGWLQISNIRAAFNELELFPSHSQIQEMVHCAVEFGSPCQPDHVTFGEFCVLVDELRHKYNSADIPPLPRAAAGDKQRRKRRDSSTNFQVFLGGSCGSSKCPTTWREEEAIPYFKKHNITFYNPQVNNWRPELIALEDNAKQVAELLLFVIDNQTRAVVSLCEVAYLVGCHRQILVLFTDLQSDITCVNDMVLTEREREDLRRGRKVLIDLIERNGIPVFSDMANTLNCCKLNLTQSIRVQDLTLKQGAQPIKHGYCLVGEALLKLRETFNSITCASEGKITKNDLRLGYRCFTGQDMSAAWLQDQNTHDSFSFEEFCCIVAEHKQRKPSALSLFCSALWSPFTRLFSRRQISHSRASGDVFDIYLGGSCGETDWREEVAIPIIKRHGLSFHNPHVTEWFNRLIPMQVAEREKCRVMLYVITSTTRSLSAMIEAAYYIGLGCRVVLCLQMLGDQVVIENEKLTECALKDYNRGRTYVSDMASREGVPQFTDVAQAVECAIKQVIDMPA